MLRCEDTFDNMGSAKLDITTKDMQLGDIKLNDEGTELQTSSMAEGSTTSVEETVDKKESTIWVDIRAHKSAVFWSVFICLSAMMWGYDILVSYLEV